MAKLFCLSNSANFLSDSVYYSSAYKKTQFSDGEFEVAFTDSIRGENVYLVQSTDGGPASLMELCLAIDAAKHASAAKVIAVIPYFGWARQDRKSKPRVSVAAKVVAKMLTSVGCDRIITCDLHADQEQAFFDIPVDHIHASYVFAKLSYLFTPETVVVSPDIGGSKRVNQYARFFRLPMSIVYKHRDVSNVIDTMSLIGDVSGKKVVLVDDMIDTAGTICKAAELLKNSGATYITVLATHGIFSNPAYLRIAKSQINKVIITNTVHHETLPEFVEQVSVSDLFDCVIHRVDSNQTISDFYSL